MVERIVDGDPGASAAPAAAPARAARDAARLEEAPGRLARWLPWAILGGIAFLAITGVLLPTLSHLVKGRTLPVHAEVPQFELETASGERLSLASLYRRVSVVNFIFTSCAGVCPQTSRAMARIQEAVRALPAEDRARVLLVSVSVDPARDTPERLLEHARFYGADPAIWIFARGSAATVQMLARSLWLTGPAAGAEGGGEEILHSSKLVLLDGKARSRAYHEGVEAESLPLLLDDLRLLLRERSR
jgi:protein SCO1/2